MLFKLQVYIVNYRIMTDISISKQYYFFIKQQNILCQRTRSKNTFYPCCTTANRFPKIFFPYLFVKIKTAVWIYNISTQQSSLKDNQLSYYEKI